MSVYCKCKLQYDCNFAMKHVHIFHLNKWCTQTNNLCFGCWTTEKSHHFVVYVRHIISDEQVQICIGRESYSTVNCTHTYLLSLYLTYTFCASACMRQTLSVATSKAECNQIDSWLQLTRTPSRLVAIAHIYARATQPKTTVNIWNCSSWWIQMKNILHRINNLTRPYDVL